MKIKKTQEELLLEVENLKVEINKLKKQKRFGLVWEDKPEKFEKESENALPVLKEKGGKFKDVIFGKDNEFVEIFTKKVGGKNLYDLRNELAHGTFSLLNQKNKEKIEERIYSLEDLTRLFILRILYKLKPSEEVIKINPTFNLCIEMADPRSGGIASPCCRMFPTNDWRIRAEWLF